MPSDRALVLDVPNEQRPGHGRGREAQRRQGRATGHCQRCETQVALVCPPVFARVAPRVWLGMVTVIALLYPVLAVDYCFMIPCMVMVLAAAGPVRRLALERPSCRRCGAEVTPEPRRLPRPASF